MCVRYHLLFNKCPHSHGRKLNTPSCPKMHDRWRLHFVETFIVERAGYCPECVQDYLPCFSSPRRARRDSAPMMLEGRDRQWLMEMDRDTDEHEQQTEEKEWDNKSVI